ncbi:MAG TPA: hypothetical protein VG268_17420 [Streptosporangiaceae bacterium]|nr:hypothetical protein [Streptosporangiaceae bacterium]
MGSWRTRASAASITGACVFAVVIGAGAVFVGDWVGSHHGTVVTEFVTTPASPVHSGRSAAARSVPPAATVHRTGAATQGGVQADAQTAHVAKASPTAREHRSTAPAARAPAGTAPARTAPARTAPARTAPATVGPASPSATPTASGAGPAPSSTPSSTDSPGTDSSTSGN